jgi:hypothetical protein
VPSNSVIAPFVWLLWMSKTGPREIIFILFSNWILVLIKNRDFTAAQGSGYKLLWAGIFLPGKSEIISF